MRALVLLYYFPPSGGPGVQRGLKLCRELPALGIEPSVVTVAPQTYREPGEYVPDPSLEAEVPAGLRIVRTPSGRRLRVETALHTVRAMRLARHAAPSAFFERQAAWFRPALDACLGEVRRARPDVLLTSSQPWTAHLVGREVRRRTGLPWVADFRDPWMTAWGRTWPSERAWCWEHEREDEVLRDADRVVANTPGSLREMLVRRPWLPPGKFAVVPNGYDPADFAVPPAARDVADFVIVHSGAFRAAPPGSVRTGLRGWIDRSAFAPLPYDLSTHTPQTLFEAMARLPDGPGRRVRARLVGRLDPRWLDLARSLGVGERVEALGYLPHREAASHVLAADLLYLPTVTRTDGEPATNVPAKTYEYLGSGRPIAALAGPGDVRDLLAGRDRVSLLGPRSADGLAALVAGLAALPRAPDTAPDPPDARPWRRGEIARRMAAVLAGAARAPVEPGNVR